MLPKKIRLSTGLFDEVIKSGKNFYGRNFWIKYLNNSGSFGYAVAISKKTAKTAVLRNRNRRIVYSVLEKLYKDWEKDSRDNFYTIIGIKKDISMLSFGEIVTEIEELLLKRGQK